ATIARMVQHFQVLLAGIAADPAQHIGELPLLTAEEREEMLVKWNDTEQAFPRDVCVHELFEAQAARTPEAVAVTFEGVSLTYRELNEQATQLAVYLQQRLNVGPDVLVGVYMERSLDLIVSFLGIWKAGGAYVPLDPFNPSQRLLHMVEDSKAKIILTQRHLQGKLTVGEDVVMINMDAESRKKVLEKERGVPLIERKVQSHHLAYVIYTSGSTGRPKGVMVEHRHLSHLVFGHQHTYHITEKDKASHLAGLGFDASVIEVWPYLTIGALVVLVDEQTRLSPEKLRDWMVKEEITIGFAPTPLVELMIMLEWPADTSLRYLMTGGEKLIKTPPTVLSFKLIDHYGPAETTVIASSNEVSSGRANKAPTIGRPISNVRIYILNKHLQPVPIGVPGEICIEGLGVSRGYINQELEDQFIASPFHTGERLYRSGDIGKFAINGEIEYIGRIDDQVKMNGVRIEKGEIETVLHRHDQVKEAVVIVREDDDIGKKLVAYVVVNEPQEHMDHILQHYMAERLPQVMVPSLYVFLDALPINANGKVDRKALPVPKNSSQEDIVWPQDTIEWKLTQVWQEFFQQQNISIRDNFFSLGGHSLLALRLLSKMERVFGVEFPLQSIFNMPTIEQLANVIRKNVSSSWSPLVKMKETGSKNPLFIIHGGGASVVPFMDFANKFDMDHPIYGLQPLGLEKGQESHTSIEEMAVYYLNAMQSVQPEGPYLIAGWSIGGIVAYEITQQLIKQKQKIDVLAVLDSFFLDPASVDMKEIEKKAHAELNEFEYSNIDEDGHLMQRLLDLKLSHIKAQLIYKPEPYRGSIHYFQAEHHDDNMLEKNNKIWSNLTTQQFKYSHVPGDHQSMFNVVTEDGLRAQLQKIIQTLK
ncbi:non-ribosomal peptide synthetase, partial [Chengkuizengella marina]